MSKITLEDLKETFDKLNEAFLMFRDQYIKCYGKEALEMFINRERKVMKIEFCRNCKWHFVIDQDPLGMAGGSTCDVFCKKFNKAIFYNEQAVCEHYKRIWWKFWI